MKTSEQSLGACKINPTYEDGVREVLRQLRIAGVIKEYFVHSNEVSVTVGDEDIALILPISLQQRSLGR